eukprot:jgi/Tetstr1/427264/TSEL_017449.t1
MAQSPLRSPFAKDRADGDEERAERGLALADGDAFWKGEPTGFLSSLNGSDKDETGGEEEGHEGEEKREPRLQGTVDGGAKEGSGGELEHGTEDDKRYEERYGGRWASYVKHSHAKVTAVCHNDLDALRYGHRRACVAAGGRRTRDEGVIWKGDPGDFYMKVIAKKFRGVWHYGVITGVVTEWVLEDYGGATQWRAVFEDGSGKVTVQSGWVMEDCLHHMETFSILNAGPLLEEARVKAIMTEKELRVPRRWTRSLGRGGLDTQRGAKARRPGQRGAKARRPGQRGAEARRPGQRGAKARRPGQRGAKARRPGQRGAKARRPGQRGAKARRPGQRGAKARRPGQRGAKARRPGQRGAKARRPGQRGAKTAHTAESAERDALQAVDGSR